MKKNSTKPYEVRTIRKDGTVIITEIESHTITYKGKKVRVAAARDITERKTAENKLFESEEKLRLFIEHVETFWNINKVNTYIGFCPFVKLTVKGVLCQFLKVVYYVIDGL